MLNVGTALIRPSGRDDKTVSGMNFGREAVGEGGGGGKTWDWLYNS